MWYPGSGVVIDCIDSCSLSHFLLCSLAFWFEYYLVSSREEDKDQESIQSSTTPDQLHHMEKCKNTRNRQERISLITFSTVFFFYVWEWVYLCFICVDSSRLYQHFLSL